ncbi:MAG: anaerobic ribonucleoside-triphosphate reductase activating protein [Thermofilaceae archaeon]
MPIGVEEKYVIVGGWKEVSLVDVLGHVSFTLWLSGCNLKCPWCSNCDLAKGLIGKEVSIPEIIEKVKEAETFVDYFHVTGGEPTLQLEAVKVMFSKLREESELLLSFDTNGTIPFAISELLKYAQHIAIDVKAPLGNPALYARVTGVEEDAGIELVKRVKSSIEIAAAYTQFLELRTTLVPGLLSCKDVVQIAKEDLASIPKTTGRRVYVLQQFIPYKGVKDDYAHASPTPYDYLEECAKEVAYFLRGSGFEVYFRTLEAGAKRVA